MNVNHSLPTQWVNSPKTLDTLLCTFSLWLTMKTGGLPGFHYMHHQKAQEMKDFTIHGIVKFLLWLWMRMINYVWGFCKYSMDAILFFKLLKKELRQETNFYLQPMLVDAPRVYNCKSEVCSLRNCLEHYLIFKNSIWPQTQLVATVFICQTVEFGDPDCLNMSPEKNMKI